MENLCRGGIPEFAKSWAAHALVLPEQLEITVSSWSLLFIQMVQITMA